jgi:hypothetical protein
MKYYIKKKGDEEAGIASVQNLVLIIPLMIAFGVFVFFVLLQYSEYQIQTDFTQAADIGTAFISCSIPEQPSSTGVVGSVTLMNIQNNNTVVCENDQLQNQNSVTNNNQYLFWPEAQPGCQAGLAAYAFVNQINQLFSNGSILGGLVTVSPKNISVDFENDWLWYLNKQQLNLSPINNGIIPMYASGQNHYQKISSNPISTSSQNSNYGGIFIPTQFYIVNVSVPLHILGIPLTYSFTRTIRAQATSDVIGNWDMQYGNNRINANELAANFGLSGVLYSSEPSTVNVESNGNIICSTTGNLLLTSNTAGKPLVPSSEFQNACKSNAYPSANEYWLYGAQATPSSSLSTSTDLCSESPGQPPASFSSPSPQQCSRETNNGIYQGELPHYYYVEPDGTEIMQCWIGQNTK